MPTEKEHEGCDHGYTKPDHGECGPACELANIGRALRAVSHHKLTATCKALGTYDRQECHRPIDASGIYCAECRGIVPAAPGTMDSDAKCNAMPMATQCHRPVAFEIRKVPDDGSRGYRCTECYVMFVSQRNEAWSELHLARKELRAEKARADAERAVTAKFLAIGIGIVNALSSREARELMHRDASFADHYKSLRDAVFLATRATFRTCEVCTQRHLGGGHRTPQGDWCDGKRVHPSVCETRLGLPCSCPCPDCKRPTPTPDQWNNDCANSNEDGSCQCDRCVAICWGDPIDCARAAPKDT